MESGPKPKTRLEELREAIARSATSIESEFSRTANDWLSCFGSRIFVIETYLSSPRTEELLSPEKYKEALLRLEALKERVLELKEHYPSKEDLPPEYIQRELLDDLNVLE